VHDLLAAKENLSKEKTFLEIKLEHLNEEIVLNEERIKSAEEDRDK